MRAIMFTYGSKKWEINWDELRSVGRGFLISVGGAAGLAAIAYAMSSVVPALQNSENYILIALVPLVQTGLNFARKYIQDNTTKIIDTK